MSSLMLMIQTESVCRGLSISPEQHTTCVYVWSPGSSEYLAATERRLRQGPSPLDRREAEAGTGSPPSPATATSQLYLYHDTGTDCLVVLLPRTRAVAFQRVLQQQGGASATLHRTKLHVQVQCPLMDSVMAPRAGAECTYCSSGCQGTHVPASQLRKNQAAGVYVP